MTTQNQDFFNALHKALNAPERESQPVVLPGPLYDVAKAEGLDLRGFIRQEPMPRLT